MRFNSGNVPNVSDLLAYGENMDTSRALWFTRNLDDMLSVDNSCMIAPGRYPFRPDDWTRLHGFFAAFPSVFIAEPVETMAAQWAGEIRSHCEDILILTPRQGAFGKANSLKEIRDMCGSLAVDHVLIGAVEHSPRGLLDLADIKPFENISVLTGFGDLDAAVGGFYASELTVWTGKRGGGKSTVLGQVMLESVNMGVPVCAYSGELSAQRFRQWIAQQAAGPNYVTPYLDEMTRKEQFRIAPEAEKRIDDWWRKKFFLYDNTITNASHEENIIRTFEYAVRKHGCAVFLLDNLMVVDFEDTRSNQENYYRAQSGFTGRLVEFAKKHEVHVHLVVHPRKTQGRGGISDADDVGGSGDITNRADNVISMERLSDEKAQELGCCTVLRVIKNRDFGETVKLSLDYDPKSRRFYKAGTDELYRQYGWQ